MIIIRGGVIHSHEKEEEEEEQRKEEWYAFVGIVIAGSDGAVGEGEENIIRSRKWRGSLHN